MGWIRAEETLGQPHRSDLQTDRIETAARLRADQLGRAAADIDDQQLRRRIELEALNRRKVSELRFGLPRDDVEIDTATGLDPFDKIRAVGGVTQGRGFYRAGQGPLRYRSRH